MKNLLLIFLACTLMTACGPEFSASLVKARQALEEKNYISTVDTLNSALTKWKEKDGTEAKGEAYELLGKAYHGLRNYDKAIDAYTEAVKLSDKTFDAAYRAGNLYLTKNVPEQAQKLFQDALRMKPNDPLALLGLGNSYFAQKRMHEAVASFEKVLDVSPGVREAQEALAVINRPADKSAKKPSPASKTKRGRR